MGDEPLSSYERAGAIAASALKHGIGLAKPGAKLLGIAEDMESFISEAGGKPAFPVNLSRNEEAAHYTPPAGDETVIGEKDLLKIDVGVQINGFIGDTAASVDFSGERGALLEASQTALAEAISAIRAGARASDVGAAIETAIASSGFRPVENLTGHSLGKYDLHAGKEIPNIRTPHSFELKEGDFLAIEPFATDGAGRVGEGSLVEIFSLHEPRPVRLREARRVLQFAEENYRTLPFAERWLYAGPFKSRLLVSSALRELVLSGTFEQYPVLKEVKKGFVSQAEHTVVVEKDSCRVLTK